MTESRNPKVDAYLRSAKKWRREIETLRGILLSCGLVEELKWGKPCYMFQASNVVIILPLKEYCTLLFCKGALLKDAQGMLVKAGENTQAARHLRFTNLEGIAGSETSLKGYIQQAIEVEKWGWRWSIKRRRSPSFPKSFKNNWIKATL